jgi:amyloid beta precursor protein binding protein 1
MGKKNYWQQANPDTEDLDVYIGIRARKMFCEKSGGSAAMENDDLTSEALAIGAQFGLNSVRQSTDKILKELVRAGGGELHNIASLIGGIGAQEVIKLLAHQYVPLDNTVVYDGIKSVTYSMRL